MHNQFKKLGFFISRNLKGVDDENLDEKNKTVKYLYKHENKSNDTKHHRKKTRNRSSHDEETKYKKHRKSSGQRKYKKQDHQVKSHTSRTELYYISPESIKDHRRKMHKSRERSHEKGSENKMKRAKYEYATCDVCEEEKKTMKKKQHEEIVDLIKGYQQLRKNANNSNSEDYQWLTKKEIFKLIANSKDLPVSSSLLKKFFVFDKKELIQENNNDQLPRKLSRHKDHNTNVIFLPAHQSKDKKPEKIKQNVEKKSRKRNKNTDKTSEKGSKDHDVSADVIYTRKSSKDRHRSRSKHDENLTKHDAGDNLKKIHKKKSLTGREDSRIEDNQNIPKHRDTSAPPKKIHKTKSLIKETEKFKDVQEELVKLVRVMQKMRESAKPEQKTSSHALSKVEDAVKSTKSSWSAPTKEVSKNKNDVNKVNPIRHKKCLVKNTFSIVEIPAAATSPVERKKKLKAFKKYYRYRNAEDDPDVKTETYHSHSDSHKMYQDTSELSIVNHIKKTNKSIKERKVGDTEQILTAETHISKIVIDSENEGSNVMTDNSRKNNGTISKNSKIPVLSSSGKMIEKLKQTIVGSKNRKEKVANETVVNKREKNIKPESIKDNASSVNSQKKKNYVNRKIPKVNESSSVKEKPVTPKSVVKEKTSEVTKAKTSGQKKSEKVSNSKPSKIPLSNQVKDDKAKKQSTPIKKSSEVVNNEESKISNVSNTSKHSKKSKHSNKSTASSSLDHKKMSAVAVEKASNEGSVLSKEGKKFNKATLGSISDTKLQQSKKVFSEKKLKTFQRSSTRASLSNSTFGDKSTDSSTKNISFLLTKTYRDDDKLNRWQKRKLYADTVRRNLINKNQKPPPIPPQVMEVRFLTVTNEDITPKESGICVEIENQKATDLQVVADKNDLPEIAKSTEIALSIEPKSECHMMKNSEIAKIKEEITVENEQCLDFYRNDLPLPCVEFKNFGKLNELFQLPTEDALNEILNENYNFLKKDFSYNIDKNMSSSSDDVSSTDLMSCEKKLDCWYKSNIADDEDFSDVSFYNKLSDVDGDNEWNVEIRDHVVDSFSVPGSEESGYSTIKSRPISANFFEKPEIKALFRPPYVNSSPESYFVEVQVERKNSNSLEIHSIESKSLQTIVACSQKSIQIKLSQEEIPELIDVTCEYEGLKIEEDTSDDRFEVLEMINSCLDLAFNTATEEPEAGDDKNIEDTKEKLLQEVRDDKEFTDENVLPTEESFQKKNCIGQETKMYCDAVCVNYMRKGKEKQKNLKKSSFFLSCIACISDK